MGKPKVFATHSLFDAARSILQESCEVEYWAKPERPTREEVLRRLKGKEGVSCLLAAKNKGNPVRGGPKRRVAEHRGAGFCNTAPATGPRRGGAAPNKP